MTKWHPGREKLVTSNFLFLLEGVIFYTNPTENAVSLAVKIFFFLCIKAHLCSTAETNPCAHWNWIPTTNFSIIDFLKGPPIKACGSYPISGLYIHYKWLYHFAYYPEIVKIKSEAEKKIFMWNKTFALKTSFSEKYMPILDFLH